MAVRRLTIPLDERACTLALGPYSLGCVLRPESRAVIERAPTTWHHGPRGDLYQNALRVSGITCAGDRAGKVAQ